MNDPFSNKNDEILRNYEKFNGVELFYIRLIKYFWQFAIFKFLRLRLQFSENNIKTFFKHLIHLTYLRFLRSFSMLSEIFNNITFRESFSKEFITKRKENFPRKIFLFFNYSFEYKTHFIYFHLLCSNSYNNTYE